MKIHGNTPIQAHKAAKAKAPNSDKGNTPPKAKNAPATNPRLSKDVVDAIARAEVSRHQLIDRVQQARLAKP